MKNWKTTLGGFLFVGSTVFGQLGWMPDGIEQVATLIGGLALAWFARDK